MRLSVAAILAFCSTGHGVKGQNVIVVYGPPSLNGNDALSSKTCPEGYNIEKCECTEFPRCDGTYVQKDYNRTTCHAVNCERCGGVRAMLTCVKIAEGTERYIVNASAKAKLPAASCPEGTILVSCMVLDPWSRRHPQSLNFTLDGKTCTKTARSYRWAKIHVLCRVVYCGDPGPGRNAVKMGTDFYYEGKVEYKCNKGAYIMAEKVVTRQELRCDEYGNWTAPVRECRLICYPDETKCLQYWKLTRRGVAVKDDKSTTRRLELSDCAASCRPSEGCISFTYNNCNSTCWLNQETMHPFGQYEQDPTADYYEFYWP